MVFAPRRHHKTSRASDTNLIRLPTTHLARHVRLYRFEYTTGYVTRNFAYPPSHHYPSLLTGIWRYHAVTLGDRVIEGAGEYRPRYRTGLLNRASRSPALALDQLAGRLNTSKHTKGQYQLPDQLPGQVDILNQPAIRATGAATRAGQLYLKPVNLAQSTKLQAPVNPFDQPASAHRSTHLTGRPLRAGQLRLPARL